MEPINIKYSTNSALVWLLISIAGAFAYYVFAEGKYWIIYLMLALLVLVAVAASVWYRSLTAPNPLIVLNADGITDHRTPYGFIPWADVESARIMHSRSDEFIGLKLKDTQKYAQRLSRFAAKRAAVNKVLYRNHTVIALSDTDADRKKVASCLKQVFPDTASD